LADLVTEIGDALRWRSQAFGERIARRAVEIIATDLPATIDLVAARTGARASADAVLAALDALPAESYLRRLIPLDTSRPLSVAGKDPSAAFCGLLTSWFVN